MVKNMKVVDRVARFILAVGFISLALEGNMATWLILTLINVGSVLMVTSIVGYCPVYEIWASRKNNMNNKAKYIS